jgi:uncharacterized membrane protein
MLHLGEAPHEVRRDVEIVHHDRQTRLDQVAPQVPSQKTIQTLSISAVIGVVTVFPFLHL